MIGPVAADRIATLYRDAMRLAEAARGYFDRDGSAARQALAPEARTAVATESIRVTARLLTVISWLLQQQDIIASGDHQPIHWPAETIASPPFPTGFPEAGQRIILAVRVLYDDVQLLAKPA